MNDNKWLEESAALDQIMESLGLEAESEQFYINGYSMPIALIQRNELWKIKKVGTRESPSYTLVATHKVGDETVSKVLVSRTYCIELVKIDPLYSPIHTFMLFLDELAQVKHI